MQATIREALEAVYGMTAIEMRTEDSKKRKTGTEKAFVSQAADGEMIEVHATVDTSKEAAAFADTPHLTGDPEWDAMELEETGAAPPPAE